MIIDFDTLDKAGQYKTMSNTIFPRPIAWISTEDEGVVNLAPFSYFTPLCSKPPLVIVSIGRKPGTTEPKDTFENILKHKVCTINLSDESFIKEVIDSSEALPKNISECDKFGIETETILGNFPPIVKGIKCGLFCEFVKTIDLENSYEPLILEIKSMYILDKCIDDENNINLDNVGRVGMEFLIGAKRVH